MSKRLRYPFVISDGDNIIITANDKDYKFDDSFVSCKRVELQNEYNPETREFALLITLSNGQQIVFCKDFEEREAIVEALYHQGICTWFI
jgi:hypothetical protein